MIGPSGPLTESPAVTIMRNGVSGGSSSGSGSGVGAGAGVSGGVTSRTFELFLVRTDKAHPENPDYNLQGLILQKVATADFAFSPFTIETSAGPLNVQIRGLLRVTVDEASPQLIFTTIRKVWYSSTGPNRDAATTASGSSTTKNPMPGPDDVLSFELPPIKVPNSSVTLPDQLSVRVRIR